MARDLEAAARVVTERCAAAPAASVAASLRGRRGAGAAGRLWPSELSPETRLDTPFDLASVTKPLVALTFARLMRQRGIDARQPLGDLLREARSTTSGQIPLELLLSHRSGLAAHLELFEDLVSGKPVDFESAVLRALESRRPECAGPVPAAGFPPVYSDMGYLLLGLALEAQSSLSLAELVRREVTEPLGLSHRVGSANQLRAANPAFDVQVAPTEEVSFRGGVVRGEVHDENAWALRGGDLAGHAGMFGDVLSVLSVGEAVIAALQGDSEWLDAESVNFLIRPRPGGSLLAGFDARSGDSPSSGSRLGPETFGHLGFTGTSIWIDPAAGFVGVLLSNRVHPTRNHLAIRRARPLAYDAMFDAVASEG